MPRTPLIIGVTGTASGCSNYQLDCLWLLFIRLRPNKVRHGDCVGVDYQAACLATDLGIDTVAHPPSNSIKRVFHKSTVVMPVKPYLDRDWDIAHGSDLLIGCPSGIIEIIRSGTWATLRYGRKVDTPRIIILGECL